MPDTVLSVDLTKPAREQSEVVHNANDARDLPLRLVHIPSGPIAVNRA